MYTKYLRGNNGRDGKTIENINEGFPGFDVTPSFAFVIKTVDCKRKLKTDPFGRKQDVPLVTLAHSWLPRSKKKFSGYLIL